MLRLEAPRNLLQITDRTPVPEQAVEMANPAVWVRTMVRQQQQAKSDLRQLTELCGNTIDRNDQQMQGIEQAYQTLAEGNRYVYDRINTNEEITDAWVRTELAHAANAYQTLAEIVWQAIIERTVEDNQCQIYQATQLARVNDVLAFLGEANTARGQYLATFQGNVELWAADHQKKMAKVENELKQARDEIRRIATQIPLPASPRAAPQNPEPLQLWRSPARPSSTTAPAAPSAPPPLPRRPAQRSPIQLPLSPQTRRMQRPAIPMIPEVHAMPLPRRNPHGAETGGPPSSPPSGPPSPPLPLTPMPPPSLPNQRPTFTPQELVQLVVEGIARAQQVPGTRQELIRTSRLKMENPEKFDGKSTTAFNQ